MRGINLNILNFNYETALRWSEMLSKIKYFIYLTTREQNSIAEYSLDLKIGSALGHPQER